MKKLLFIAVMALFASCNSSSEEPAATEPQVVNIYSHRHYDIDQTLFDKFKTETGITVNVVKANADELLVRLEQEGDKSPADLLVTSDAGRLARAAEGGFLQPLGSAVVNELVPSYLRDANDLWTGLTMRARVIVCSKERVPQGTVQNYADLAKPEMKGKVLCRSSDNLYNQSLMAGMIAHMGDSAAAEWAKSVRGNMAREPKGNDRDQVMAIAAGEGDVSIVNTYYLGLLSTSENPDEVLAAQNVYVVFPDQNGNGTHVNVSGAGLLKHAPNKANAVKLIEFLLSEESQRAYADANFEYPVRNGVAASDLLISWGDFKRDELNLSVLGSNNPNAVEAFRKAGWE